jgi:2Fe-2S ferredoxin
MPTIIYIQYDGTRHEIEVPVNSSVMRGAVDHGISGIDADCGGLCACATCHVHVDAHWFDRLAPPNARERDMLGFTAETDERSRLSCQIQVTEALHGLVVYLPQQQH